MTQYGFYFNAQRCTGCRTCVLACKDYHDLSARFAFRQVYEYGGGAWSQDDQGAWSTTTAAYYVSVGCNHCALPVCAEVCPTGAMHKDDLGIVSVDTRRCVGCAYCNLSCPYRAPKVDRQRGHSVKCDGCRSRLAQGRKPICVEACTYRALDFGPIEELRRQHGRLCEIPPLAQESSTLPNLCITPPANLDQVLALPDAAVLNQEDIV